MKLKRFTARRKEVIPFARTHVLGNPVNEIKSVCAIAEMLQFFIDTTRRPLN